MKFRYTTDIPEHLGTAEQWDPEHLGMLWDHYYGYNRYSKQMPAKIITWDINTDMNKAPKRSHDPMGDFLKWNKEYCVDYAPLWWCSVDQSS